MKDKEISKPTIAQDILPPVTATQVGSSNNEAPTRQVVQNLLHEIPHELIGVIASFLPKKNILNLTITSSFFQKTMPQLRENALFQFPLIEISTGWDQVLLCYRKDRSSGDVFSLELNDPPSKHQLTLQQINSPLGCIPRQVLVRGANALILYENGEVWNFTRCLAPNQYKGYEREKVAFPEGFIASKMVAGQSAAFSKNNPSTFIIDKDGEVWGFGDNTHGQLGVGIAENHQHTPKKVTLPEKSSAKQVAAGTSHSVFLSRDGRVFVSGRNFHGQLGLGDTHNRHAPQELKLPEGFIPKQVVAGDLCTLILSEDGKVLRSGSTHCRHSCSIKLLMTLREVELPERFIAKKVVIEAGGNGADHIFIIGKNGRVWAFGGNNYGQLGVDDTTEYPFAPKQVALPKKCIARQVTVGSLSSHSVILSKEGKVFVFGRNARGQLGLGDTQDRHTPQELPVDFRPRKVGMGPHDTFLIGDNATILYFGRNSIVGQLDIKDSPPEQAQTNVKNKL